MANLNGIPVIDGSGPTAREALERQIAGLKANLASQVAIALAGNEEAVSRAWQESKTMPGSVLGFTACAVAEHIINTYAPKGGL